jgi:DNA topoisomerase-1
VVADSAVTMKRGSVRLRRSSPDQPGFTRRRSGRGFTYTDADGRLVDAEARARITALVIPPAWRDVWISPYPNGHLQAVGTDAAGRRQYLYHERWSEARNASKHVRVLTLATSLPAVRDEIDRDLRGNRHTRERALAVALRILDVGVFRTGGEEYAIANGSHGVVTLLREHVRVRRDQVLFDYVAKGGIDRSVVVRDATLAQAVASLRRARTGADAKDVRLMAFRAGTSWQLIHPEDVNQRFKELAGDDFTVKDLRTWHATVFAAVEFAQLPTPTGKTAFAKAERAVMVAVAEELGNTPAVARRSYVDPTLVEHFRRGQTISAAIRRVGSTDLTDRDVRPVLERAVTRLLRN